VQQILKHKGLQTAYIHTLYSSHCYGPHLIQTGSLPMQKSAVHPLESAVQDMQ